MRISLSIAIVAFVFSFADAQNNYPTSGNVGINLGGTSSMNKLQIGPNPQGWNGNDLVISNTNGSLAIYTDATHTYLYGSKDIAIRPGYGQMSIYSKYNGYVGFGTTTPNSRLHVNQSLNTDWAGYIYNAAGSGKGLRIQSASGDTTPVLQVEDNYGNNRFLVQSNGSVGIGTMTPDAKLTVKGDIHTREVKVDLAGSVGPDYVFEKDYPLTSLSELKTYIDQNKHLPEIPSAKEMEENGINLKEMNLLLLKKVEELTFYVLDQEKRIERLEKNNNK